jgi:hypothetical protein
VKRLTREKAESGAERQGKASAKAAQAQRPSTAELVRPLLRRGADGSAPRLIGHVDGDRLTRARVKQGDGHMDLPKLNCPPADPQCATFPSQLGVTKTAHRSPIVGWSRLRQLGLRSGCQLLAILITFERGHHGLGVSDRSRRLRE